MATYDLFVGMDVGKSFHWMHVTDPTGKRITSHKIDQDEHQLDQAFTNLRAGGRNVLVVVDQPKNIGALTLACAARAGCDTKYLPGLSMRRAAGLIPGDAKTDRRDAEIIAFAARALPEALRPVAPADPTRAELEALVAYDADCLADKTRQTNRLHALLAHTNPMFEKAIHKNIDTPFALALLQRFGGPWGMRHAGQTAVRRWAGTRKRVPARLLDQLIQAAWNMDHEPPGTNITERLAIPAAARHIAELADERKTNAHRINTMLANNPTYTNLLTMPGIGPHTAATLVTTVQISQFPDHEKLASYAGLAARTTQSGTSIKGETATRAGNRALKNALFQSAFASLQADPKSRAFYDTKRAAGKLHNTAIIALARKRLKIIYAIMRDGTPYRA